MQQSSIVPDLFSPVEVGRLTIKALTRSRGGPGNVPNRLNALGYGQRASADLIVSEATQISPEGQAA